MRRSVKTVLGAFLWMEAFSVGMDRGAECFCFEGFGAAFGFRQGATWYNLLAVALFQETWPAPACGVFGNLGDSAGGEAEALPSDSSA